MDEDDAFDVESAKLAINNVLWMYAHPDMTLKELEELACDLLFRMRKPAGPSPTK